MERDEGDVNIQKARKPYIITQSNLWLGGLGKAFYSAGSCSQKYCKSLNLETDCKRVSDGLVYRSLCFPLTVPGTSHFPSQVYFCVHCPCNARSSWQLDNLAAWTKGFFTDDLPYPFSLCLLSWIQFFFCFSFLFFWPTQCKATPSRKYQGAELGLSFVVSQDSSLTMRVTVVWLKTEFIGTDPSPSASVLCDFWVSHNLSVFSFLKSGDKAAVLFIHLPERSFVKVS